jgi:hypothetical protein
VVLLSVIDGADGFAPPPLLIACPPIGDAFWPLRTTAVTLTALFHVPLVWLVAEATKYDVFMEVDESIADQAGTVPPADGLPTVVALLNAHMTISCPTACVGSVTEVPEFVIGVPTMVSGTASPEGRVIKAFLAANITA